jgi:UDP-glucuronate 4-epimerase
MQVLVTGVAGFIGYHVARALLRDAVEVVGVDNLTPYYDLSLKEARLDKLSKMDGFHFIQADVSERELFTAIRAHYPHITHIIHLAAQPGVRRSSRMPEDYISSNISTQLQVLEYASSLDSLEHVVYASSSSVYGGNEKLPFREDDAVDKPLSFYGVTKRSAELMAEQYAHAHGMPITGLRFFTSYGAYGRPDMAYYRFTKALYADEEITLFHKGEMRRDFTHISDTLQGILAALYAPPEQGHRLINLGNHQPESVNEMLSILQELTGREARIRHEEREAVEPIATCADITRAQELLGFSPQVSLKDGMADFVTWFCDYHNVS